MRKEEEEVERGGGLPPFQVKSLSSHEGVLICSNPFTKGCRWTESCQPKCIEQWSLVSDFLSHYYFHSLSQEIKSILPSISFPARGVLPG